MSVKFKKTFAGITIASGEVEVSTFLNVVTLGWAERRVARELEDTGLRVFTDRKRER